MDWCSDSWLCCEGRIREGPRSVSAHLGLLRVGKQVHGHIVALGTGEYGSLCSGDNAVPWSALIDMYFKCSNVMEARSVLDGFT
ncbi:repeat-containing protein [Musa troglodytarum]|uniref:Repeat-containing protein n=1 Tax=Musa troglodytarum TaxID=320322 RepID=A0A9E7JD64_9LILI|nr:repeat-containing protein [Musa troglodytarum]